MDDKSWAFFGLSCSLASLGFVAGMNHEYGVAAWLCAGAFSSAGISWAMTAY